MERSVAVPAGRWALAEKSEPAPPRRPAPVDAKTAVKERSGRGRQAAKEADVPEMCGRWTMGMRVVSGARGEMALGPSEVLGDDA